MLRMKPIANARRAADYFGKGDGGYYLDGNGLRREWGGKAAPLLGLTGAPTLEQFTRLLRGLHPLTGEQLTALLRDDHLAGWDFTVSLPKGATAALEGGDTRIPTIMREAGDEAMNDVQGYGMTRVRKGGMDADRTTGNMAWLCAEHAETRPTKEDGMPDWDRHLHYVVANETWDDVEKQWKALKVKDIFKMRKYFSHCFDLRMSAKLAELGYEIETKLQPDGNGGMKYHTWDIKAAPGHEKEWQSVNDKNSRRHKEIEETEAAVVAEMKERDADAPDRLSAVARDKLGATSRQAKRKDMTLADLREYWNARLTPGEHRAIAATIERAKGGGNPPPGNRAAQAMEYAIAHEFTRNSVVDWHDLATTAMEKAMGSGALPEDLKREAGRQGVWFAGDQASTQAVLAQEERIIGFARAGKGVCRALAPGKEPAPPACAGAGLQAGGLEGLSGEQKAAVRHVWNSTDRIMLIRGGAGTGKTTAMTPALKHLGAPAVLLAPSSDASRGELRRSGFSEANTVAAFLGDGKMQESVRGGGIIWIDEASLLPVKDLDRICDLAKSLDARIVLQGDPAQHKSVNRHGNMLTVLEKFAHLPVVKLTVIQRQKGDYAKAVAAIRDGKLKQGDAVLRKLGWVIEGQGHDALVAEYARAIEERKPNGDQKTVLVVDPTHKDGDLLTEKLRAVRKEKGLITGEERTFARLVPRNWTDAEKADASRYGGSETVQFFRNSGRFKAGDRVKASALLPELPKLKPEAFAVFGEAEVKFAVGDTVRITTNGRDVTGKHRVDNGRIDAVKGFTRGGDIVLSNGWVLAKDFAHIKHGLVSTSHATQSRTDDVVLAALNKASLGAMSAEQGYVTISRGRERGMIFTDLPRDELLDALARADNRLSATELRHRQKPQDAVAARAEAGMRRFLERVRTTWRQTQRRVTAAREWARQQQQPRGFSRG